MAGVEICHLVGTVDTRHAGRCKRGLAGLVSCPSEPLGSAKPMIHPGPLPSDSEDSSGWSTRQLTRRVELRRPAWFSTPRPADGPLQGLALAFD